MSGSPPAYQHSSNDAWLNNVVGDIVSDVQSRRGSLVSRSWSSRDDDAASSAEGNDATAILPTMTYSQHGRQDSNSQPRSQCHPRLSTHSSWTRTRDSCRQISECRTTSAIAKNPEARRQTARPGIEGDRSTQEPSDSNERSGSPRSSHPPARDPMRRRKDESEIPSDAYFPTLEKRLSTVSEFSGFQPHPAVGPLEPREALGEASGPPYGADDDNEEDASYPGPLALSLVVLGICLSVFIVSLDRNIITTAIPEITAEFRSYGAIGWYGSAYLLTASAFQPLYGRIYMAFATKSTFLMALGIFQVGSVVVAASPSSDVLIVGRAIQGMGAAGLLTGSFVVATDSVRLEQRPILFAVVGILYGVGALCGPLLGGAMSDTIGWRWCFWINLPIGAVTFLTVLTCFKNKTQQFPGGRTSFLQRVIRLDWIGNCILLGAMAMLFLALQYSEERFTWSSARCIGLLCGFGATTAIFILWVIWRGDTSLIPPRIVRQRTVAASCGAGFLIYGAILIHSYYLPVWFQAIKGTSAVTSGVNMIPYMAGNAIFSLMAGIFVSKNGRFAPPSIVGCAIATIGSGLLATMDENTPTSRWVGFQVLISAGLGMAIQQGFSAVQAMLPLEEVPIGTAAVVASQSLGGAIFVSVGNTLLQDHLLNENTAGSIPGVNVRAVFQLGPTQFRNVVPPESLPALVTLYNESLKRVFIAAVPLCGTAFICSCFMEWKSIKRQETSRKKDDGKEMAMSRR